MKSRLISELHRLSTGQASMHLSHLMQDLNIPEENLRKRAGKMLQNILHAYSHFYVSTIDSFFQRIIRSFTREMGIQNGYSVELDTDTVLEKSIDMLQAEASVNASLLQWLTDFAGDRIERGNSWNFRKDITKLGQQLFNEHFKVLSVVLAEKLADKKFMSAYQQEMTGIRKKFESHLLRQATTGVHMIQSAGLDVGDFIQKERGPAGYLLKTSKGIIAEPNTYVLKALESTENWYSRNTGRKTEIQSLCQNGLLSLLQEMVTFYTAESRNYFTAGHILRNMYTLGILADLGGHLMDYCRENNIFILSEASSFLNRIIDNNDTPFVYEKTGNHFHHFMIDEFQDTSQLQWNNFKPLISNSLSQNYDNLLVGDVKQSIYRWRNSNWEILANGVASDFYDQSLSLTTLDHNHRSCEKIIVFNNTFFQQASLLLQDSFDHRLAEGGIALPEHMQEAIAKNFADAKQLIGQQEKTGGKVRIEFTDAEDYDAVVQSKLAGLIDDLLENGFSPGEIAVLTRRNNEAGKITDFLINLKNSPGSIHHTFDVISEETLYLSSSPAVRFLIGLLKYIHAPGDVINTYFIVNEYISYIQPEDYENRIKFFPETTKISEFPLESLFPGVFFQLKDNSAGISLFELVEKLIAIFGFDKKAGEAVYLQTFQDEILKFTHTESSSIVDFIEFWDDRGYKKPVTLSGSQQAIRVLTMHKAKGLEFPVVIIPYCDWNLTDQGNRSILWCHNNLPPFNQLSIVPVDFSSDLKKTHFAGDYFEELLKQYVDSINLLYVAFTRPSQALFCFAPTPSKDHLNTLPDLLLSTIMNNAVLPDGLIPLQHYYRDAEQVFDYGEITTGSPKSDHPDNSMIIKNTYPVFDTREIQKIAFQGKLFLEPDGHKINRPVSEGRLMHEIFSRIMHVQDIPIVLNRMSMEGKIAGHEVPSMSQKIHGYFSDLQVQSWFSDDWKVATETEFIVQGNQVRRPDRVMTMGDKAIIIDYKFGTITEDKHKSQVIEYQRLLLDMHFSNVEGWLWYVILNRIVKVC